ncbi:MAG TPA: SH3 domain-containing protein [Thermomicrobiales bacterium]|nr:SH3 domain-containing protein [Thermomicrobiales bacterium]
MQVRVRYLIAGLALLIGLLVTPVAHALPVAAQENTARTIALDVFRCPPGVTLQQMVAADCTPITSGVDVTLTSINGTIAPLTIADAALDGNTFRWDTTASGSSTDEWGFTHGALPEGTSAFLVQGEGVVAGQGGSFDYRFTTSFSNPAASLDMFLLMSADAPVIEPPSEESPATTPTTTTQLAEVTPEATAGLRPSPTATATAAPTEAAPTDDTATDASVDSASTGDSESVAPADTGDTFVAGDQVEVAEGPLNLRSAAGTTSTSIGSLAVGAQLTIVSGPVSASGYNWYQVKSTAGQTGWVIVDALQIVPDANADFAVGDQVVVFDGPVNLRASAGTSANVVQSLPQETLLTVTGGPTAANGHTWYQVQTADSASGWVAADFIHAVATPPPPSDGGQTTGGRATVIDGPVNLRSAAGIGNAVVTVLQTGDTLDITGGPTSADGYTWYAVKTSTGSTGWVAGEFLKQTGYSTGDIVYVNTDSLNVRSEAGLNSTVLDTIFQGTSAVITGGPATADSRDWYKIDVSGVVSGWVAAEYLALSSADPVDPPSGNFSAGDWIFVTDPPLNLRDTPSTSGQVLASLSDGDGMLVLGETVTADGYDWNQVENDGVTGYVAAQYVAGGFALGEVAVVADGPVNLRSAAGTGNQILAGLAQGAQVSVLDVNPQVVDGVYWFQVTTTDSVTGWVAGRYLGPGPA